KDGPDAKVPFGEVAELLGYASPNKEAEQAALYLASNRVGMLRLVFEWVHEDGSSDRIPVNEIYDSLKSGIMRSPKDGTDDQTFKTKICLLFEPTGELIGRTDV